MSKKLSKRLICLLLSLIFVLSVCLTSCSDKSDEDAQQGIIDDASESAETLAMYLMSEKPVSAETAQKIEDALNLVTENKYKIHMELSYFTEAEYYTKLQESFDARALAKANGTLDADKGNDGENTQINEFTGKVEIKFPNIASYQVDIFYLGGEDNYNKYLDAGMLADIDDALGSSTAKEMYDYVPQQYFEYIKVINDNDTYAVPMGNAIGDYTYLLLNKDAMEQAYRRSENGATTYEEYTSLTCDAVQDFLTFVGNPSNGMTEQYYPLYTSMDKKELLFNNVEFMGVDAEGNMSEAFSVLGGYLRKANVDDDDITYTNMYAEISNLMKDEAFLLEMERLVSYEQANFYGTPETNAGKKFAVGYVTGGAELALEYGDEYEMIPVGAPVLEKEEVYEDLLAVCSYSSSVTKSMQIINLINTDEDIRNLILYGIKDEHYRLINSEMEIAPQEYYKLAERLNEDYVMAMERTGNTLIATPLAGEDAIPDIKEYMVQQNQDAVVNLTSGFRPHYMSFALDDAELQKIRTLSETIWAEYLKCDTVEKFNDFVTWATAEMAKDEYKDANGVNIIDKHIGVEHKDSSNKVIDCPAKGKCTTGSLACAYNAWLKELDVER